MRKLLLSLFISGAMYSNAQIVTAVCDVLGDIEGYKRDNTMSKIAGESRNLDGSMCTSIIPARFVESSFRDFGDGEFFLEFYSYGTPKQMEKVLITLFEVIERCYPDLAIEEGAENSEKYRKFLLCTASEAGGTGILKNYKELAFILSILHTEGDQSKITLKF